MTRVFGLVIFLTFFVTVSAYSSEINVTFSECRANWRSVLLDLADAPIDAGTVSHSGQAGYATQAGFWSWDVPGIGRIEGAAGCRGGAPPLVHCACNIVRIFSADGTLLHFNNAPVGPNIAVVLDIGPHTAYTNGAACTPTNACISLCAPGVRSGSLRSGLIAHGSPTTSRCGCTADEDSDTAGNCKVCDASNPGILVNPNLNHCMTCPPGKTCNNTDTFSDERGTATVSCD